MPSAPSIRLELRPSRWQHGLTVLLWLSAAISLACAPWSPWLRILAVMLLSLTLLWQWRHGRSRPGPVWIEWRADDTWQVQYEPEGQDQREPIPADLRHARVVGPLIGLHLRLSDHQRTRNLSLHLWPDSANPDQLRRLRIRLARTSPL